MMQVGRDRAGGSTLGTSSESGRVQAALGGQIWVAGVVFNVADDDGDCLCLDWGQADAGRQCLGADEQI
ncbi:hypothetical protein ACLOJK_028607 [Asimina triloba]